MNLPSSYDYIIAGGGAAGLSLLYHILQSPLQNKSILVIDKSAKNSNDRTWCFWEEGSGTFESIVHHQWKQVDFLSENFAKTLEISPYSYKMIRGIDFYQYVQTFCSTFNNVHFLHTDILSLENSTEGGVVQTEGGSFQAQWVFSSIRAEDEKKKAENYHYLLQHFKGWVIKTPYTFFDPEKATLMDFRIEQEGDCRFMYVLPTGTHTALVEYTLFSHTLLKEESYDQALIDYLRNFHNLDDYTIEHEEFGVIPMTNMPYPSSEGKFIINIGTAGGVTKPSTGYTFKRIQEDSQAMVQRMLKGDQPHRKPEAWKQRFMVYDSTLLNVMALGLHSNSDVFTQLFKNNPPQRVFRFLDEKTSFWEEIKVANSVPKIPFLRGLGKALLK